MTDLLEVIVENSGEANPKRPIKAFTDDFTAEAVGKAINKKGFGLVGLSWPALAGLTLTIKVGLTAGTLRTHDAVSIDVNLAGATSISDLAEWPFIQINLSGSGTGLIEIALS